MFLLHIQLILANEDPFKPNVYITSTEMVTHYSYIKDTTEERPRNPWNLYGKYNLNIMHTHIHT